VQIIRTAFDAKRIAIMGRSFGGYWAAKMAFVEAKRLRASVVWGGGVHYFFQPDWLRESTNAESYLMDHDLARCSIFGVKNVEELLTIWPSLSLKNQGWLEKPSCPMLIVNGKDDVQTPISDLYILLEYHPHASDHRIRTMAMYDDSLKCRSRFFDIRRGASKPAQPRVGIGDHCRQGLPHFMSDRRRHHVAGHEPRLPLATLRQHSGE
jgi:pimeloyl-ACP methyl ester carboxylesterase